MAAIAVLSLVLPLYLWGATGHLRNSLRAWWSWWKYMLAAVIVVGAVSVAMGLFG